MKNCDSLHRWLGIALVTFLTQIPSTAADTAEADTAWQGVLKSCEDPPEGKAIRGRRITGEERIRLRALLHPHEWAAADQAAAFRERYPEHVQAAAALKEEVQQLIFLGDVALSVDT